jgi:type I restriction enzyme, S subunit
MKPVIQTNFGPIYQNWKISKFPDCVFFQEGPGLREWQWTNSGMKVINVKNILLDGSIDLSNSERYISMEEFRQKYSHFAITNGDILVSSSGWSYGKVSRVNKSHLPVMMNTSVVRFHPLSDHTLDCDYLFAFLRSSFFRDQIESFIIGVQQPNFGPSHIKEMIIVVPPLPTQRRIAAILSVYDDLIENSARRIAILEEMARNLYREWFVEFRFPGHETVRMVDGVPEGWEAVSIREVTSYINRGVSQKYDDGSVSIVINQKCIRDSRLNLDLVRRHSSNVVADKYVQFGDVLINSTGIGTLGRVAQVYQDIKDCTVDSHLSIVRPKDRVGIDYFGYYLIALQSHFDSQGIGSTGQTELGRETIARTDFLLPPKALQDRFGELVSPIRRSIIQMFARNTNLRRTRDLLLPKLVSGELDVSELEIAGAEAQIENGVMR